VAIQPENPGTGSRPVHNDRAELRRAPADPGQSAQSVPPAAVASFPILSAAGRGRWRFGLILAALALGLAGLTASAAGIAMQILPRRFNAAQQQQIMAWESARHWRVLSAGKIFPATVSYQVPAYALGGESVLPLTAHRVGIAPQASCGAAAASPGVGAVLDRHGCVKMLRATYIDATGSLVVTVGVAVMPGQAAAEASARALPVQRGLRSGVRPLAYPDTLTTGFGDAQRQLTAAISRGPYLILSATGYADGRPRVPGSSDLYDQEEMTSLANGVTGAIGSPLGALPALPRCPGAPGC
jgi:hypothetical protein